MAKGYWIARITVTNPERYKDYVAAAAPVYGAFGGVPIVRGGAFEAVEGEARPRNVVIAFPTHEAARAAYYSPEYTKARAIRQEASQGEFIVIEGYEA
jgi:uncharacterized protein (DUF1330 family)